jgi:DNA-binding PadR family transcriptional regulator
MPIQHAVLALLTEGPSYGYELRSSFEEAIGPQWGELNIGHVYQVLDRLVRDGLVTKRRVDQETRPDKNVYRITKAGQRELEQWLSEPHVPRGYRDEFFLKLFAAARVGSQELSRVIADQRTAYQQELAGLTRLQDDYSGDPLVRLLIAAAIVHTQANVEVTGMAEREARQLRSESRRHVRPKPETSAAVG